MDQQGSTPEVNAGANNASPQSSADNAAPQVQPSQPTTLPAQNGDLLGGLEHKFESGQSNTGSSAETPSQTTTEQPVTPQAPPQNQGQPNTGDSVDQELTRWASSQGLSLNTETEIKLAKRLRDTQKWAHETRADNNQTFSDIQNELNSGLEDPIEGELRTVKAQLARRDFWDAHAEDKHLEGAMIQEVQNMLTNGDKAGAQYYSTPQGWQHLLAIVKTSQSSQAPSEQFEAGRQTERENLARVQQAAPASSAAVSSAPQAPVDDEALVAKMGPAEYEEWRKTHNPFAVR
jgi:hypothetical protein